MTVRLTTLKRSSFVAMSFALIAALFISPTAHAGLFNVNAKNARALKDGLEIETDIKVAGTNVGYVVRIPQLGIEAKRLYAPNEIRKAFLETMRSQRETQYAADKLLKLQEKYPDLKQYLIDHPSLKDNALALQRYGKATDDTIKTLQEMVKYNSGNPMSPALMHFAETNVMNMAAIEKVYPGLSKVMNAHPELREILATRPNLFKPAKSFGEIALHTMARWPIEALSFYAGMGAVYYTQLLVDSATNPEILEQQWESQKDPVTHFSFIAFMLANGFTSEAMMHNFGHNSWVQRTHSYAGMAAGMIASEITSEVLTSLSDAPSCVAEMTGKTTTGKLSDGSMGSACEKTFGQWTQTSFAEKVNNFTPGMLSMAATTFLAPELQAIATKFLLEKTGVKAATGVAAAVGRKIITRTLVLIGVDMAIPEVRAAEWVVSGVVMGFQSGVGTYWFMGLNTAIEKTVQDLYRNTVDTVNFQWHDENLQKNIQTEQGFRQADKTKLAAELMDFGKDMRIWRQANMSDVAQAQATWQQYLSDMKANYGFALEFYQDFLHKLAIARGTPEGQRGENVESASMDLVNPLLGMKPQSGLEVDTTKEGSSAITKFEYYTNNSKQLLEEQQKTMLAVGRWLKPQVAAKRPSGFMNWMNSGYNGSVADSLWDLSNGLISGNWSTMLSALKKFWTFADGTGGYSNPIRSEVFKRLGYEYDVDHTYLNYLNPFSQIPGETFLYGWNSKFSDELKGAELSRGEMAGLPTQPKSLAEYYMTAMIYGPDASKGQSLIQSSRGWKVRFVPPRISSGLPVAIDVAPLQKWQTNSGNVDVLATVRPGLDLPLLVQDHPGHLIRYQNILHYIRRENLDAKIYNHASNEAFNTFWKTNVEKQFVHAWVDFEEKYQIIVSRLMGELWTPDKSSDAQLAFDYGRLHVSLGQTNAGPAANGILSAMNQEFQVYLITLGRLMNEKPESITPTPGYIYRGSEVPSLIYHLRKIDNVKWSSNWQSQMSQSYRAMEKLLLDFKVVKAKRAKDGSVITIPLAPADSKQFDANFKAFQQVLAGVKEGVGKRLGSLEAGKLSPEQTVALVCIEKMSSIATEMQAMIAMANIVSYQIHGDGTASKGNCDALKGKAFNPTTQSVERQAQKECERGEVNTKLGIQTVTGKSVTSAVLDLL